MPQAHPSMPYRLLGRSSAGRDREKRSHSTLTDSTRPLWPVVEVRAGMRVKNLRRTSPATVSPRSRRRCSRRNTSPSLNLNSRPAPSLRYVTAARPFDTTELRYRFLPENDPGKKSRRIPAHVVRDSDEFLYLTLALPAFKNAERFNRGSRTRDTLEVFGLAAISSPRRPRRPPRPGQRDRPSGRGRSSPGRSVARPRTPAPLRAPGRRSRPSSP